MIDWDSCVLWLDSKYFSESWWWDRSKYNNDGVVYGAKFKEDGFYFDGSSYIDCGNSDSLNITGEITIEVLVIPFNLDVFNSLIFKLNNILPYPGFGVSISTENHLQYFSSGKGSWVASSYTIPTAGILYHCVTSVDGDGNVNFYINGDYKDTRISAPPTTTSSHLKIGIDGDIGSYPFNGIIPLVRIFKKVLSYNEIKILARNAGV